MIKLSNTIFINNWEYSITAIHSQGPGGQNVNKVATAIHLRFNIKNSTLPVRYKDKLLSIKDQKITKDGIIVIKSQVHRSQIKNKEDAIEKLKSFILTSVATKKKRKPTRSTLASRIKRMDRKTKHSKTKLLRKRVDRYSE